MERGVRSEIWSPDGLDDEERLRMRKECFWPEIPIQRTLAGPGPWKKDVDMWK